MNTAALKNTAGAIKLACKALEDETVFPKVEVIAAIKTMADQMLVKLEQEVRS